MFLLEKSKKTSRVKNSSLEIFCNLSRVKDVTPTHHFDGGLQMTQLNTEAIPITWHGTIKALM